MSVYVPSPIVPDAVKAGPIGQGAGVLMTESPLSTILGRNNPQAKMRTAYKLGIEVPWIRAAERVIAGAFSAVPWHLEDGDDVEIDDEYANPYAQQARALIAKPNALLSLGQRLSRSDLWRLTCRHMGLCGNAFWFLDGLNAYGIPNATLYIRPDRMWPDEDKAGNLVGWWIDRTANDPGIHVNLEQVLHFMLEPPDSGHFGIGLVESAIMKAQLSLGLDKHLAQVLGAGGRLAGILAPKAGDHLEEPQYQQLVADARTIVEQPDAAKRLQVLRGPVEFTPTAMNSLEMALREFMVGSRDDLLALWGVPVSMLGIHDRGRGLGAAEVVSHDDATLWQMAVHPRLGNSDEGGFVEVVQGQLLDRWTEIGVTVELEIDEPTFDDDGPKYDQAQKAASVPLRNAERREILGLEPFGPDVLNPATGVPLDDEVWLPVNMVQAFVASADLRAAPQPVPEPATAPVDEASAAAGETSDMPMTMGKARLPSFRQTMVQLRASVRERMTPRVVASLTRLFDEQRREVAARVRGNAEHVARKPADSAPWWDGTKWNRRITETLKPTLVGLAEEVDAHVRTAIAPTATKAGPVRAVERVLTRGAARVTAINERTRAAIIDFIVAGIEQGLSPAKLADDLEAGLADVRLATGEPAFDELRAETIARTETGMAYNDAALGSYADVGIEYVEVEDGDQDDICAEVAGQTFPIDDAPEPLGHPNCTRDFLPVIA